MSAKMFRVVLQAPDVDRAAQCHASSLNTTRTERNRARMEAQKNRQQHQQEV